jgi:hypothetical protein
MAVEQLAGVRPLGTYLRGAAPSPGALAGLYDDLYADLPAEAAVRSVAPSRARAEVRFLTGAGPVTLGEYRQKIVEPGIQAWRALYVAERPPTRICDRDDADSLDD